MTNRKWTKRITFEIRDEDKYNNGDETGDVWICEDCEEEYENALDAIQCECEEND